MKKEDKKFEEIKEFIDEFMDFYSYIINEYGREFDDEQIVKLFKIYKTVEVLK